MTDSSTQPLQEFLHSPARPQGTLSFHELQGFLFAIASSPETIPASEWLPHITDEKDPGFKNEAEAQRVLKSIVALYNDVNTAVLERSQALPPGCDFCDDVFTNFDDTAAISQWSQGFAIGHDWLSEVWEEYLPDEMDEECGVTTMILSFFGSRQLGEAYFLEANPHRRRSKSAFKTFAETIRELFPRALASYAHLGRTIHEFFVERADDDAPRH